MEPFDPDRIRLAPNSWEAALEIVQEGLNPERSFIVTGPSHGPRALKGLEPSEIQKALKLVSESWPAGFPQEAVRGAGPPDLLRECYQAANDFTNQRLELPCLLHRVRCYICVPWPGGLLYVDRRQHFWSTEQRDWVARIAEILAEIHLRVAASHGGPIDPDRIHLAANPWQAALDVAKEGLHPDRSFVITGPEQVPQAWSGLESSEIPEILERLGGLSRGVPDMPITCCSARLGPVNEYQNLTIFDFRFFILAPWPGGLLCIDRKMRGGQWLPEDRDWLGCLAEVLASLPCARGKTDGTGWVDDVALPDPHRGPGPTAARFGSRDRYRTRIRRSLDPWQTALDVVQEFLDPERSFLVTGPQQKPRAWSGLDPSQIPPTLERVSNWRLPDIPNGPFVGMDVSPWTQNPDLSESDRFERIRICLCLPWPNGLLYVDRPLHRGEWWPSEVQWLAGLVDVLAYKPDSPFLQEVEAPPSPGPPRPMASIVSLGRFAANHVVGEVLGMLKAFCLACLLTLWGFFFAGFSSLAGVFLAMLPLIFALPWGATRFLAAYFVVALGCLATLPIGTDRAVICLGGSLVLWSAVAARGTRLEILACGLALCLGMALLLSLWLS